MVDAIVSFVVDRIGDYLIREAIFLREVRNEVKSLRDELAWMQCFIKDADQKQSENLLIRKWVSEIRDIAYDTEDVLDKFLLQVDNGRRSNGIDNDEGSSLKASSRFFSSFKKKFHKEPDLVNKGKEKVKLYSIGKEIEALRSRISDLSLKRERYGLQDINNKTEGQTKALQKLKQLRRSTSFAVEENVIGFEDDANKLLAQLLNNEPRRFVISIVGMGGLGKTTLAGKIYHNEDVKKKFDCCAWVSVSLDYEIADLLRRLIKSFKIGISNLELEKEKEEDLERLLCRFLHKRSYLVAIDDVWQKAAWESLKRAFPDNKKGSRVIITTRIKYVAERSDERTHVHELRFLRPEESWQLFCEKAFRNMKVDDGLEKLGREMVEKCSGLPLAIVVLGGLLSTKKAHEWRVVRDHIWRHLRNDSIHISNLLALSFNDLSYHVKLCFLYLGLYPEDFEIDVEKLIRLLVAEGLIPPDEDQTIEDTAQDHLIQLIDRSLIQVEKRWWGKIKTLRVHDVLRDLAIEKGKDLNFIYFFHQTKNSTCFSSIPQCRRQAVYFTTDQKLSVQHWSPLLRSVLLFSQWDLKEPSQLKQQLISLSKRFTLSRVLHLEHTRVSTEKPTTSICLPEEIGKLVHLKYLGLRNSFIGMVPPSILINLQSLQTLDLLTDFVSLEMPIEICKLKELRHLTGGFSGHLKIDNLTNLQTLKYVSLETWARIKTDKLVNLRKLYLGNSGIDVTEENFTFDSISKLPNLQLLSVELKDNSCSFGPLEPLSHCSRLVDLRLRGGINELPKKMHEVLPILECLSLEKTYLEDDPMLILEKLSNLVILALYHSYTGEKMVCRDKGFPRLEILSLQLSPNVEELQVEEGAMTMIRGLSIPRSSRLKIPERLRSIPCPASGELDYNYWSYHGRMRMSFRSGNLLELQK